MLILNLIIVINQYNQEFLTVKKQNLRKELQYPFPVLHAALFTVQLAAPIGTPNIQIYQRCTVTDDYS